jgi:nitrogen fixation protein FixH
MTSIHMPPRAGRPLTGRKVLAIGLAAFGVVIAVNALFVVLALGSWSGLERRNAYLEGLDYNRTLARAEAQHALGWRLDWQLKGAAGGQVLEVRLGDAGGRPVAGVAVTAEWRRPTHEGEDATWPLAAVGDGVFRSEARALGAGNWNLVIEVARGGETMFRREDRVWLK